MLRKRAKKIKDVLNKSKSDPALGQRVHEYLKEMFVETPLNYELESQDKKVIIEEKFHEIMTTLELNMEDDSLRDTPKRVAKMFVDEIFYGLDYNNFPKCTTVENKMMYNEMVSVKNITAISNCEHHFVVIDGICHVGYIPKEKVLGLSKINRIVDFFCKRPQIQERCTEQIYHALSFILETKDIGVIIEGVHYCVKSRGIRDTSSSTITSKMGGTFRNNSDCRREFLALIDKK